jgi:hypothetical protein
LLIGHRLKILPAMKNVRYVAAGSIGRRNAASPRHRSALSVQALGDIKRRCCNRQHLSPAKIDQPARA